MNCRCGNAARYINERGELCCAICPLKEGIDSIRLADVPALLAWARKFANLHVDHPWQQSLREIVGRAPALPVRERTCVVLPTVFAETVEEEARRFAATSGEIIDEPLAQRPAVREKTP